MAEDPSMDWEDLLGRVRANDQQAASQLVEALYPFVIRIVRGHLPRRATEEELAQEVFVKVFAKMDQFSGTVPFTHWVSRVALMTCIDQLRRQRARPEYRMADLGEREAEALEMAQADVAAPTPADAVGARELLNRLMESLSPEDRVLVTMVELEGHSVEEASKQTGWSKTLVRVRLFRARRKLKKALEALNDKERP